MQDSPAKGLHMFVELQTQPHTSCDADEMLVGSQKSTLPAQEYMHFAKSNQH